MASAVAYRYARALVDLVMDAGSPLKPEEAVEQLRAVEELISGSAELRTALLTPAIQTSRKRAIVGTLLERMSISQLIRNFTFVVINHRRVTIMGEIREAFEQVLDERVGVVRAQVSSAAPLDERRNAALETELSKLTGKRIRMQFVVDPALIGGVVARIGSTLYDGSIRGQFQELRRKLVEESAE
jgi:F-type H+-transporting ATPase subunit delta